MATPAQAPAPPAPPATTEAAIPAAAGAAGGLEMQHVWSPGFFLLFHSQDSHIVHTPPIPAAPAPAPAMEEAQNSSSCFKVFSFNLLGSNYCVCLIYVLIYLKFLLFKGPVAWTGKKPETGDEQPWSLRPEKR